MNMPLRFPFKPMEHCDFKEEAEQMLIDVKEELSERQEKKLLEENALMRWAYASKFAKKVNRNNYVKDIKPFINITSSPQYNYFVDPIDFILSEEDSFLEDAALIFFAQSALKGKILIAIPELYNALFCLPMEQYNAIYCLPIQECISGAISTFGPGTWKEFKRQAKIFKFDPSISHETIVNSKEPLYLTVQEFLDECKNIDRYGVVCVEMIHTFIMPGRVIAKLDELESGLSNNDPNYTSLIPQELKDTVPNATDKQIQETFVNTLTAMYIEKYINVRLAEVCAEIADYYDGYIGDLGTAMGTIAGHLNNMYLQKFFGRVCTIQKRERVGYSNVPYRKDFANFMLKSKKN